MAQYYSKIVSTPHERGCVTVPAASLVHLGSPANTSVHASQHS